MRSPNLNTESITLNRYRHFSAAKIELSGNHSATGKFLTSHGIKVK